MTSSIDIPKPVAILRLSRLSILPGGILAYLLGTAVGVHFSGGFGLFSFLAGFLLTEIANLSAHYFDEYADLDTDSLTRRTIFTGGSGVLPQGLLPPSTALNLGLGFGFAAVLLTLLSVILGWIPLVSTLILLLGLFGGWAYSMKPIQLERRGLAEVTNAFIGGFLMPLMGLTVQTGELAAQHVIVMIPVFLIVLADLLGGHWADREADLAVGKSTLAALMGKWTPWLFAVLVVTAYGFSFLVAPRGVALITLAVLPFQVWACASFWRSSPAVPASLAMATYLVAYGIAWVL